MMFSKRSEKGFTLVEMAIVILILGLIIGSVFSFLDIKQQEKLQQQTRNEQKLIAQALGNYAQIQGRLPCPGSPNATDATMGYPINATVAVPWGTCTSDAARNGILPYRVLGLKQEDAIDAYGRPYTYAVSMQGARQQTSTPPPLNVAHINCRTDTWQTVATTVAGVPTSWTNKNTAKAIFCCQPVVIADQMNIYNSTVISPANLVIENPHDVYAVGNYANPNTRVVSTVVTNLAYIAYALISHGENGFGAYVLGQSARSLLSTAGTGERENADDANATYMDLPRTTGTGVGNTGTFDDIVMWRTQQSAIRDAGSTSCAIP